MVSNIDETRPITGIDQPVQVIRDNFTIAKIEITELQARKFDIDGTTALTGPLELVSFTLAGLPPPIDNEGSLVYVTDSSPPSPFFSDGLTWSAIGAGLDNIVEDSTPQLGGELDAQTNKIINLGAPTADTDAATKLYVDTEILSASLIVEIVNDLTPQLGGELDSQNNKITNLGTPTVGTDAATKNYVDTEITSGLLTVEIVNDTTPQLGGELNAQNFKIINLATPTAGGDATNKTYVDSLAAGLDPKESVRLATVGGDLAGFVFANNGGVGDTLTAPGAGFTSVDSTNLADENRVLVKNQADPKQNGIYIASATGSGGTTVLTRATDQDGSPSNEVSAGNFTFVETGSVNGSTGWVVIGDGVITINVGDVDWAKFSDVTGALVNIVDDTTPQLGSDLDVNGFSIVSVSNGDIAITPNGSGSIILDGLDWPQSDGSNGQVLTTDGGGNLSFTTIVSGGLNNIVEDLSPQLGANLDANTFDIEEDGNVILSFSSGGESAVNWLDIVHATTGSGPIIRSVGADTNVDLLLQPKGTGEIQVGLDTANAIITAADAAVSSGEGGRSLTITSGSGDGVGDGGNIFITPGTAPGAGVDGFVIVGTTGDSEIRADINSSLTIGGGNSDSNADAGGTLIISGNGSASFASGDITITPGIGGASDGNLILDGLTWPVVDGTAGQALTTDGAGTLGFASVGGSAFTTQIASLTPIAAVDDDEILVDTVALAVTVNLPGSPTLGDRVRIVDGAGNAATNNITVGRNGEVIMGIAADFVINVNNAGAEFVYMNVTNGWRVVNNV